MPPPVLDINGVENVKYVYPAIFRVDKERPDCYTVEFPDIELSGVYGYGLYEALEDAEKSLQKILRDYEDREKGRLKYPMTNKINPPTPIEKVVAEPDEYSKSAFVTLIKVDTDELGR